MNNDIPFIVYEESLVRHERERRRLFTALLLSILGNILCIVISAGKRDI